MVRICLYIIAFMLLVGGAIGWNLWGQQSPPPAQVAAPAVAPAQEPKISPPIQPEAPKAVPGRHDHTVGRAVGSAAFARPARF